MYGFWSDIPCLSLFPISLTTAYSIKNWWYWLHNNSYHPNYCFSVTPNSNTNGHDSTNLPSCQGDALKVISESSCLWVCVAGGNACLWFVVFFVLLFRVWTCVVFLHLISVEFKIRQHQRQPTSGVETIVKKKWWNKWHLKWTWRWLQLYSAFYKMCTVTTYKWRDMGPLYKWP